MDLVLHKKLLALQAENAMLKEEIQKLQEAGMKRKERIFKSMQKVVKKRIDNSGGSKPRTQPATPATPATGNDNQGTNP